jgi:hypothetical protein
LLDSYLGKGPEVLGFDFDFSRLNGISKLSNESLSVLTLEFDLHEFSVESLLEILSLFKDY